MKTIVTTRLTKAVITFATSTFTLIAICTFIGLIPLKSSRNTGARLHQKCGRALMVTGELAEIAMREHNVPAKPIDHLTEHPPMLRGVFHGSSLPFARWVSSHDFSQIFF